MERETPTEGHSRVPARVGVPATDHLSRAHWLVPVCGATHTDLDGTVQLVSCRDGTVIMALNCGDSRTSVRLDASRAAQLSTGVWEAAGVSQQFTDCPEGQLPSPPPPHTPDDPPVTWRADPPDPPRNTPAGKRPPRTRKVPVNPEQTRMMGQRIRRIRHARHKSLRVISGLSGMSITTLHHVECGRREVTISEIVALARALETIPSNLVGSTILASLDHHLRTTAKPVPSHTP